MDAREYDLAAVCVRPIMVEVVADLLADSNTRPCVVIDFPDGKSSLDDITRETELALRQGACEFDYVAPGRLAQAEQWVEYRRAIKHLRSIVPTSLVLKVIIEAGLLGRDQIIMASHVVAESNVDFVKTSTGVHSQARLSDIALIRATVPASVGIKAAGGIRTLDNALDYIRAGSNRIGTSSAIGIMRDFLRSNSPAK